jgi:hypothetical protein
MIWIFKARASTITTATTCIGVVASIKRPSHSIGALTLNESARMEADLFMAPRSPEQAQTFTTVGVKPANSRCHHMDYRRPGLIEPLLVHFIAESIESPSCAGRDYAIQRVKVDHTL